MKKLLWIVLILSLFIGVNVQAAPKAPPYIVSSSDCTWLTFFGVLCHDTDDGKLYKWTGAALAELAAAAGTGDISDVWGCSTGDCEALTAGAADSLNATSASYIIPFVVSADCSGVTAEGRACWDSATDTLYVGDGAAAKAVGTGNLLSANNTWTGTQAYSKVNAAGGSADVLTLSGTLGAMDGTGTDIFRGLYLNYTNANHTGGSFYGIDIGAITGDAEGSEYGIKIGIGWDYGVTSFSPVAVMSSIGLLLYDDDNSALVTVKPAATTTSYNVTLPAAAPAGANYLLNVDADGTGNWTDPAGFQAADNTLTSIASLTIADVSILEGTAAETMAVVTSGGALRYLRSKSDNSALEFSATINGSAIDIHGTTAETTVADADEVLIYSAANGANRMMTKGNFVAGITASGITLDLADDGSNESTSLSEIATSGDTNSIFTEPSANKLLIDVSKAWPLATLASTVTVAESTDTSSYIAMFDASAATTPQAIKADTALTYNSGTGVLTASGFAGPLVGAVTGAVTGNADTATALAANPDACAANQYVTDIAANGTLTCAQPASTALSDTSALAYLAGAQTFTANNVFGNADTDTFTMRSLLIGGNSRAVWIAATAPTPTYATGTNELYVAGDIETAGNIYASSFVGGTGTDTQRRLSLTSNTSIDCATYPDSLYFVGDSFGWCQSTAAKTPARLEDTQTFTGKKTFQGDIAVGDASNAGSIDIYDGSSNYFQLQVPALSAEWTMILPTGAGTTGQYLKTTTSGTTSTMSWDTPAASANTDGGTGGVQFNAGGVLTSDAGFVFTTATDKLALGSSGGATTGTLDLYYTGTTYAATITPNSAMSADVTITLPDNTSTLIGSGANTFTGNQILDDGTGASPTLTFTDETNETVVFGKADAGYLTITTVAGDGVQVTTGNLRVGNGSNGQTLDGEDLYVEGLVEIDGVLYADGGLTGLGAVTFGGATSSIPMVVGTGTASGVTAAGSMYFESDTEILTIGDGATSISLDMAPNVVYTFPAATSTLARTDAGQTFTGVQAFTAPTVATSIAPASADGATLGTAAAEFSDLYLAAGGVIYGENAQENTLTSSATGWVTNLGFTVGPAAPDDVQPTLVIRGDADSDAAGDTTEAFTVALTANADPTLAKWGFTSTQSAGYTFDKPVQAPAKFVGFTDAATLTAAAHNGALVMMTTANEVTMWDCTASTIGHWVTLWARDAEKIEVVPASGDQFYLFDGTGIGADDELDMAATAGTKVTLMCTAANEWRVVYETAACADGGAAD